MTRTKEFDPDAALGKALDLFWERGYEATSIADLVERLGIGRQSIYATFGGKHDLYLKALDRYVADTDALIIERLARPGPVLPAIRALLRSYAQSPRGCMVVNAAVEFAGRDAQAASRVSGSWDTLEKALTAALTRARDQHEISAHDDPRALARFLIVTMQGIRVLGRAGSRSATVRDAVAIALRILEDQQ